MTLNNKLIDFSFSHVRMNVSTENGIAFYTTTAFVNLFLSFVNLSLTVGQNNEGTCLQEKFFP